MSYADITVNDRSRVKRTLQRRRLDDALRRTAGRLGPGVKVIDIGGGDGNLLERVLALAPEVEVVCYEPAASMRAQAEEALRGFPSARVVTVLEDDGRYDVAFCCEVFEHLPAQQTKALITFIARVVAPGGVAVSGVPNEIHLMGLLKELFRMARRYGEHDAVPRRVLAAGCPGSPEEDRWERALDEEPYIFEHGGFDHRRLRAALEEHLVVTEVYASPFPFLPLALGSEIYFVCEPRS